MFDNKKIILIGDKDALNSEILMACIQDMGYGDQVIYREDECFAWGSSGVIGRKMQADIIKLTEEYGVENLSVLLGISDAEAAGLTTEALTVGDPTFSGALTGVSLGLEIHHLFELKDMISEKVYMENCGLYDRILNRDEIIGEVECTRNRK